jgi:hypothetical protein
MEGIKEPARNWITFVLGGQMGPTGTEEDTYVAVLERAPQKNEEVMIVFTNVVQCQYMVYRSVHGPRVGVDKGLRMAAYNDGKCAFSDWWQFTATATDKGIKRTQPFRRRIITCWYYRCY